MTTYTVIKTAIVKNINLLLIKIFTQNNVINLFTCQMHMLGKNLQGSWSWQRDWQTDRPCYSVCSNRLHLATAAMRPKMPSDCSDIHHYHHNHFTALFMVPPRWAGASTELLDFMVQGKINRGRHTGHPAGCPPSGLTSGAHLHHPPIFLQAGCPSCRPTNSVKAVKESKLWHTMVSNMKKICGSLY